MSLDAKHAAAQGAIAMNDAAAVLAAASGVAAGVGFFTGGVGFGVAAVFAVASGVAWYLGDDYSQLSLDPPRHDYHLVTKVKRRDVGFLPGTSTRDAVWSEFNATQVEISDAVAALITSFERLEGARVDLRKPGANSGQLARHMTAQRQAITHNAAAATRGIQSLLRLRHRINAVWRRDADVIRGRAGAVSPDERRRAAAATWEEIKPTIQRVLRDDARLAKARSFIVEQAARSVQVPDELLDARWSTAIQMLARRLAVFAGGRPTTPGRHELDRVDGGIDR
jgi:hypothetical protein